MTICELEVWGTFGKRTKGTADGPTSLGHMTIQLQADQGLCLDASGGALASGDQIILWTCHGEPNQDWILYSDGTIRPGTQHPLCMDAGEGPAASGDRVRLHACSAARKEQWDSYPDGTLRPRSDPNLCMNGWGGGLDSGDEIGLYPCSAAPNEVFIMLPTDGGGH